MGGKELPIEAYYGIQTLRAVENFPITGYKIHESLIRAFAIVSGGLANTDVGRLELNKGGAIAKSLKKFLMENGTIVSSSIQFRVEQVLQ